LKLHDLVAVSQNLQPHALDLGSDELDVGHVPTPQSAVLSPREIVVVPP
jgi:hypothetical protein